MAQSVTSTIDGPSGPLRIVCGEATKEQLVPSWEMAAAVFLPQFSPSFLTELQESMLHHPLLGDDGARYWCVSLADDPLTIIAMTGALRRPLLIRDTHSMHEEDGYCLFMVATHPQYRRLGLAKMVVNHIAEWLDRPGGVNASMLYTSVGDFYVGMGWDMVPCTVSTITSPTGSFTVEDRPHLPVSRFLTHTEIAELSRRDAEDVKASFEKIAVADDEIHLVVVPNPNMINYSHEWGDIIVGKTKGKTSKFRGAICEAADTWIFWHHFFDRLVISRIHTPSESRPEAVEVLASLLLVALEEAKSLEHPKVTIWEPSAECVEALEIVKKHSNANVETGKRPNSVTSVRWKGSDRTKKTILHLNESYAAS